MNNTRKYVDFIIDEILPGDFKVILFEPQNDNKAVNWKIGPSVFIDVKLTAIDRYSRSAKFKIVFDKYEKEQIIYIPYENSPRDIIQKIVSKLQNIVYSSFVQDGRSDEICEKYRQERANFGNMFAKINKNIENE